jgi:hypothetical protein
MTKRMGLEIIAAFLVLFGIAWVSGIRAEFQGEI